MCCYLRSYRLLEISHNGNSSDRVVCFGLYGLRLFSLFCFAVVAVAAAHMYRFFFARLFTFSHNLWNVLFALHIERISLYGNSNRFTWWLEWVVCKMRTCASIGNSFPIDVNRAKDAPELNAIDDDGGWLADWLQRQWWQIANAKYVFYLKLLTYLW